MKKIVLLFSFILALTSCSEGDVLETDNVASGPKIVGFKSQSEDIAYFSDEGVKSHSFPVVMVGYGNGLLPSAPIALQYEVDLVNSTAVEGVEFDFANSSKTVVIPAGADHGSLELKVNTGNFNLTQPTELYLKLKGTSGVTVGEKQKTIKITFVGCATDLARTYSIVGLSRTSVVTKIAPNKYRASYLPRFGTAYWFEFTDTCGVLEITDWQFNGGNPMTSTDGGNVMGYIDGTGRLVFEHANVEGVSWYVDYTFILY